MDHLARSLELKTFLLNHRRKAVYPTLGDVDMSSTTRRPDRHDYDGLVSPGLAKLMTAAPHKVPESHN
jgi:hypothetical protein